jgi:hypothetical protein
MPAPSRLGQDSHRLPSCASALERQGRPLRAPRCAGKIGARLTLFSTTRARLTHERLSDAGSRRVTKPSTAFAGGRTRLRIGIHFHCGGPGLHPANIAAGS